MADSIRRMLWGAFVTLVVLVAIALVLTLVILNLEKKQELRALQSAKPLVDAVREMDADTLIVVSSARGYVLTRQTLFEQQQADAIREFDKAAATAMQLSTDPYDARTVNAFKKYFGDVRGLSDRQIALAKQGLNGNAVEFLLETTRVMQAAPGYAGIIADYHAREQTRELQNMAAIRQWLIIGMVIASVL